MGIGMTMKQASKRSWSAWTRCGVVCAGLAAAVMVFCGTAYAETACDTAGYSIDKDPKGLNVRSQPGIRGRVIARLKAYDDGGYIILPEFRIIGSQGEWLKITEVHQGLDGRLLMKGSGWVHSSLVATSVKGYTKGFVQLRTQASANAPEVTRVPRELEVRVRACQGKWLRASYKGKTGWLAPQDQCATAQTTCN